MRLILNNNYNLYELDSESELIEYVRINNGVIVGNNVQVKSKFYIIEYLINDVKNVVGIINEGHGIIPNIVILKKTDVAILMSDKSIYFYDLKTNKVIKCIMCDSLIFELINYENVGMLYIVCELGILCLTTKGKKVWSYDSDIISNFEFHDKYINITVEDIEYKISLFNGKII